MFKASPKKSVVNDENKKDITDSTASPMTSSSPTTIESAPITS